MSLNPATIGAMDEIKLTYRYWRSRIIPAAFRASFSFKSLSSKVFGIATGFAAVAILVFAGFPGQIPGVDEVVNAVLKLVLAATLTGLGTFFLYVLYLPAKIYEEQGGFMENPFEITAVKVSPPYIPSSPSIFIIGLPLATLWVKVTNKSRDDIEDCFLLLSSVLDLTTNQLLAFEPLALNVECQRGRWKLQ